MLKIFMTGDNHIGLKYAKYGEKAAFLAEKRISAFRDMVKKANEEGITVAEVAARYIEEFWVDAKGMNIREASVHPRATENIEQIIGIIEKLVEKGYAYESNGDVYYRAKKFGEYGKLSHQPLEDLEAGARINIGEVKREPMDFALWKSAKPGEPYWESPWGHGRPGWHIECSAISVKTLGEYLDIHCGGIDNAFPHHTNEIAQSEAYLGHPWCKHWFHVLHLNTANGKMSKSSGKALTLSLLEENGYNPLVYRFFCLQSHYRKNLVFSWEGLDNAVVAYNKLVAKIASLNPVGEADENDFNAVKAGFVSAMDNDLNTSLAITAVYDALKAKVSDATKIALIKDYETVLSLGLMNAVEKYRENLKKQAEAEAASVSEEDKPIVELVNKRTEAKKAKNFALADSIRDQLKDMGIVVEDTPQGPKWKRI